MQKVFKFYNDPAHGWLAVKRAEVEKVGVLNKISSYSYQRGKTVYLEEDCDASLFLEAYKAANPETIVSFQEKHTNSSHPIRSYERFTA